MIPRRLHYVWVGSSLPEEQRGFIATWQATNPGFEIIEWNEKNIDFSLPGISQAYERRQWAKVADIARLAAVYYRGGIYLDTDFKVLKPLDPLLSYKCFYGFQHAERHTDWVANGAFGAEAGHWFVRKALDCILSIRTRPLQRPTAFGPKLVTKLLCEEGLQSYSPEGVYVRDVFLCPVPVFYPFAMGETFTEACVKPETLAAHFWHESWASNLPVAIRIARKVRKAMHAVRA